MTLLERYIFGRAAKFSLASLASLVTVVWIVQVLQRIDIVRTTASAAGDIFWIALMLMPDLAAGVLPFAVLIGAVQALNGLNGDSERAVIDASGAGRMTVANPILLVGAIAGLVVLFNSHVVGPAASSAFQNGIRAINADAISLFLRPGRFESIQPGLVISIDEARGRQIEGLFLNDTRDPQVELNYFAREAQVLEQGDESFLILLDGQLHRRTTGNDAVSVIQFQTYAFDLSSLRPSNSGDWIRMSERSTQELINPDPNEAVNQLHPTRVLEELTARRTDWLYPIAFTFWAVVVAGHARTNRQASSPAMLIALGGALALKALGFVALSLVGGNTSLAFMAYLVPAASIGFSALLYALDVDVLQTRVVTSTAGGLRAAAGALSRLVPRRQASVGSA